ncbi:MAG: glycosyltransferase family 2 protein [Deltaproteobacteria bacterium]|nr:glycosyltransferase family 2 protein [Deltaproteobacteria bacterium]MBW2445982.1 glycosyltransferase family 2 protein [Deltaproteobacteria bacterium]
MAALADEMNPDGATVDVVVPIYNEEENVPELLRRLRLACPAARLIFVDNASTDRTCELLSAEPDVTLVRHATNLGYGHSLIDGVRAGEGAKVVMLDADLEYLPEDVPAIVEALDRDDAVYGSRILGPDRGDMGAQRYWGNRFLTSLFNLLFAQRMTDIYTGVRGFRRRVLDPDTYRRMGFDYILELTAVTARRGGRIGEVPCGYHPRSRGISEMNHLREFVKFLYLVVYHRLTR